MNRRHHERPLRRRNPSGELVWVARYTNHEGRRVSAGTFKLKREAQDAIDAAYDAPTQAPDTLGAYFENWTARHPRSRRTNDTNEHRVSRVLDVAVEGRRLRDWPLAELRRRHVHELVDHLLRVDGRARTGAVNILRALSVLFEDAITDELAEVNPVKGVRIRPSDPRIRKHSKAVPVFTFEQMHAFAAAAGEHEAMVRVLSDCGLRLGELLGLERRDVDGQVLHVRGSAHKGVFTAGDQETKRHVRDVPLSPALAELLATRPSRIDTRVLFPTAKGTIWIEENFRRQVWTPAREASGMHDATPHSFRHSWESQLHAAGVDPADLAAIAGHTVATMQGRYVHALGRSHDRVRELVG